MFSWSSSSYQERGGVFPVYVLLLHSFDNKYLLLFVRVLFCQKGKVISETGATYNLKVSLVTRREKSTHPSNDKH